MLTDREGNREAQVFRTITSADWARSIADARAQPNLLRQQIRMAEVSLGLRAPEELAKLP